MSLGWKYHLVIMVQHEPDVSLWIPWQANTLQMRWWFCMSQPLCGVKWHMYISLLQHRLPELPSQCNLNKAGNLGNLEIRPYCYISTLPSMPYLVNSQCKKWGNMITAVKHSMKKFQHGVSSFKGKAEVTKRMHAFTRRLGCMEMYFQL